MVDGQSGTSEWRCTIGGDDCFSGARTFDNEADAIERAQTYGGYVERREVAPWEPVYDGREP